ncbi:aminotransferase class III-fold pyridoxal phosphate-dependent enzyme [Amycolatopsis anabasis]|uniref:aminotransferase class III-fold pyridoxal phosphate-dependent enzyme n=1 Tax=Amycolatopsis anabasis TaxID=1840409 RepID=UPI00131DCC07|nr:aminotransferase class III-fold pyridoxal phosphate-dependent enzyme [Amycolatopsis anabasis]
MDLFTDLTAQSRMVGSMPGTEILARAAAVAARPFRPLRADRLAAERRVFTNRTPGSARLFRRGQGILALGSEHVAPLASPYPLFLDHGNGSNVVDVDGNTYVDNILAGGALVLGHNHPGLTEEVVNLLRTRTGSHGHLDEYELLAAEQIRAIFPAAEAVRFTSSGTEATLAAARLARAFTGRERIVKFRGHNHGWGDQFMVDAEVHPHRFDELERALAGDEVAAVIAEPYGSGTGLVPFPDGFHEQARELAATHGTLYVFDEVVTGTGAGLGGAQTALGVTPDLFTLGKGLMNGYPSCGAVAGRKEIVGTGATEALGGGPFAFLDGAFAGNVLSAAACYHTLTELTRTNALAAATAVAAELTTRLNQLFADTGVDFFAYHFGAILRIELTAGHAIPLEDGEAVAEASARRDVLADYMIPVANAGVLSRQGRDMVSCAHTAADVAKVVNAYAHLIDCLA